MVQLGWSPGAIIMDDMGLFRVDLAVENPARPGERRVVTAALVDTGAELSWIPASVLDVLGIERYEQRRFRQANGTVLGRWTGHALIYVAGKRTADDVVFGEPGDLVLLGSRTLEGLNVRVEPVTKQLVDAGPAPAAAVRTARNHSSEVKRSRRAMC
ncbi:MAG TPA: retroviral-like aspartic protease family protein [Gemmatimonadales bacterium]|nr:retroviral-like aspartic protease family protein [Gemmatimonadales bacterium]